MLAEFRSRVCRLAWANGLWYYAMMCFHWFCCFTFCPLSVVQLASLYVCLLACTLYIVYNSILCAGPKLAARHRNFQHCCPRLWQCRIVARGLRTMTSSSCKKLWSSPEMWHAAVSYLGLQIQAANFKPAAEAQEMPMPGIRVPRSWFCYIVTVWPELQKFRPFKNFHFSRCLPSITTTTGQ